MYQKNKNKTENSGNQPENKSLPGRAVSLPELPVSQTNPLINNKVGRASSPPYLEPRVGLEPTTFSLRMRCSNQLSYCG